MKVIAIVLFAALNANAAAYNQFYIDGGGKKLDTSNALMSSVTGGEVYLCKSVEAKASKSGTSIGMHAVKKPKAN